MELKLALLIFSLSYSRSFHISSLAIILLATLPLVSLTLAVLMHEVSCVGYTPHIWDPSFLQFLL